MCGSMCKFECDLDSNFLFDSLIMRDSNKYCCFVNVSCCRSGAEHGEI